ncbi:uncharacterized protein LOC114713868 [Neltuma alba]|uniref:uncharacterized protein LOC114713868 n=1 Tax=Neltuma alba TaxID=207710 RepID=UPI0010A2D615|nr:uncharacterized protein LOC114713868 [Prosopis alba]
MQDLLWLRSLVVILHYANDLVTKGLVSYDTLTLALTNGTKAAFPGTVFGCGYDNGGVEVSSQTSDVVGLVKGQFSLISQMGPSFKCKFPYCLIDPFFSSDLSGKLSFGQSAKVSGPRTVSTPIVPTVRSNLYYLSMEGISVEGTRLNFIAVDNVSSSNMKAMREGSTIIDSGTTTLTALPQEFSCKFEEVAKVVDTKSKRVNSPVKRLSLALRPFASTSVVDVEILQQLPVPGGEQTKARQEARRSAISLDPTIVSSASKMLGATATSTALRLQPPFNFTNGNSVPRIGFLTTSSKSRLQLNHLHFSFYRSSRQQTHFHKVAASSSSSAINAEYVQEPATKVKFETSLSLPGCSNSLTLFGTGYREKVFAIVGVKVYAAGLYLNQSITSQLNAWQGQPVDAIQGNSSLFKTIFQSPFEKSLQIILVRDVDGKTFWDALDDAISPRIKAPTPEDAAALSTFRSVFQNRPLKKGTFIFLTWLDTSKLLVFVSFQGLPSAADATIESANVASALFDVFFGDSPVSSTLKASVADGLSKVLK